MPGPLPDWGGNPKLPSCGKDAAIAVFSLTAILIYLRKVVRHGRHGRRRRR